jgi:hypothetical protein
LASSPGLLPGKSETKLSGTGTGSHRNDSDVLAVWQDWLGHSLIQVKQRPDAACPHKAETN